MKHYIRGVGSGLPIVHDWVELKNGRITIDSNIGNGAAVTISLVEEEPTPASSDEAAAIARSLGTKERAVLLQFKASPMLGVTEVGKLTGMSPSTATYQLEKLESAGLLVSNAKKKREITKLGNDVLRFL